MTFNKVKIIYKGNQYTEVDYRIFKDKYKNRLKNVRSILIQMKRTPDLLFAIMMCLEFKITYTPVEYYFPMERIQYIMKTANVEAVLNNTDFKLNLMKDENIIEDFEDIAYILFTSGSTGKPKGVKICRKGIENFIDGITEKIDFSFGKRIACLTTVSFDIFFLESIMALYKGLTVFLADDDEQRNPKLMAKLIRDNNVEMIQMTPSRMQLLLNHDKGLTCLKNVKEIMIGGESFPLSLLRTLQEETKAKIYNMYGPTETTIWSSVSDLTNKDRVDIGCPIKNTDIYIVDEDLSIVSDGQAGEICISGEGLAKGYARRDDLTKERFINLLQKPFIRVYRTGDLGRYLQNGNLEYLGRTDNQVKIRGHRIELEEIEAHLNQFDGIKQSIVITAKIGETDKALEAFYTSDTNISPKDIIDYLSSKLPSYMIPAIFKRVGNFIQTPNGKIDRKKVLECIEIRPECDVFQTAVANKLNDAEKKVIDIVVLIIDAKYSDYISLNTELSSVGMDSITFIKIIVTLESEFDFEFDDEKLLFSVFPTIKSIVEYVESKIFIDDGNR